RHASQARPVLGRLNLIVGIGDQGRCRAEHHRAGKNRHCGNALRHDGDPPIDCVDTMSLEQSRLQASATAELSKGYGLLLILVYPERNEVTLAGSSFKRFDKIAVSDHTLL